jgi:hypothetical protein
MTGRFGKNRQKCAVRNKNICQRNNVGKSYFFGIQLAKLGHYYVEL